MFRSMLSVDRIGLEGTVMQTVKLSAAAVALLCHRLATRDNRVTPDNLEAYRELARAGIMFAVSGFVNGPEASFRFTDAGWQWVNDPANLYAMPSSSMWMAANQSSGWA